MGKKGSRRHLKRSAAPDFWPIHVKEFKWAAKPDPGPHPKHRTLPLLVILRDILGYARNAREARLIVSQGKVKVDGRPRTNWKYPAGLMDTVEMPDVKTAYRILPQPRRGLSLVKINGQESSFKICRIEDKATNRKGAIQLKLHDGRNLMLKVDDPRKPPEGAYRTLDSLQVSVPELKILNHIKFDKGAYGIITAGKNIGRHGKIVELEPATATRPSLVTLQSGGESFRSVKDYVFIVGSDQPIIKLQGE